MAKVAKLKSLSIISKRYGNVSFENTQTGHNFSFDNAFDRCKRYCENYQNKCENGHGLYLFGAKGSGKTHLTACIANELLKKCVSVLLIQKPSGLRLVTVFTNQNENPSKNLRKFRS